MNRVGYIRLTDLNDTHLFRMVDDTGIYQHAKYDLPNPTEGYTTDDNARLMMMAAMYYESTGLPDYLDMCYRALGFLQYACKDGWFRNFMGFDRRFLEDAGSPDCFGRCIWCLGYITSRPALPDGLRRAADELLAQAAPNAKTLQFPRSCAYAAMGLALWKAPGHANLLATMLERVTEGYTRNAGDSWDWFENEMTYCNATLPHALLSGYEVLGDGQMLNIGLKTLDFLLEATTRDGFFWPIGCQGWYKRGAAPALYDQQPVEACGTILCCLKAYEVTGEECYREKAQTCFDWFLGGNSQGVFMIDTVSGGCYDGLEETGPNLNQGSESLLSWCVSVIMMETHGNDRGFIST